MRTRVLSPLNNGPNHFTHEALRRVLSRDPRRLAQMSPRPLVELAARTRDEVIADYDQYLRFRAAALEAAEALGATVHMDRAQAKLARLPKDPAATDRLFFRALVAYRQLFVATE